MINYLPLLIYAKIDYFYCLFNDYFSLRLTVKRWQFFIGFSRLWCDEILWSLEDLEESRGSLKGKLGLGAIWRVEGGFSATPSQLKNSVILPNNNHKINHRRKLHCNNNFPILKFAFPFSQEWKRFFLIIGGLKFISLLARTCF